MMDSKTIARKLEAIQPEPPLYLDSPFTSEVDDTIMKMMKAIAPNLLHLVPKNILSPVSADYYNSSRQAMFGMSLDEVLKTKGGESAWEAGEHEAKGLIDMLKRESGPFLMGKTRK